MTQSGSEGQSADPLSGVRVLEVATGRPARIAGMLLSDLGADVVRAVDPGSKPERLTPRAVCWDRGKRVWRGRAAEVSRASAHADVVIVDAAPSALPELGWDSATLRRDNPDLVHVWMPAYAEYGEWKDLPEDPLLLAALSGAPYYYPADDDSPVAPISAGLTHIQGALGAAAAMAGLVGRVRQGVGQSAVITGIHAAAALMGTAWIGFVGGPKMAPGRDMKGGPNWRLYQCSDGEWLFLAALTPDIFFRALEVLDRLDVMALPEVGGDWMSIMDLSRGRPVVTAVLEPIFASNTSTYWQDRLRAGRVPCAIVQSREAWIDGPIVGENLGRRDLNHPVLGPTTLPNIPIILGRTPGSVHGFATDLPASLPWPDRPTTAAAAVRPAEPGISLPLDGVRVVDGTSFLAGPMTSAILADFGADVVRIEPPTGDTYRAFSLSFLAANQRKRGVILDLKRAEGVDSLHALLAQSDIYVENLRPRALAELMVDDDGPTPRFPHLVHCSLSAFGRAEAFADLPGFDPVFQVLSGMAMAQGPDGHPIVGGAPLNDVATGALGALGSLAALYHRLTGGPGQRLWVSLAASASFIQSGEFTTWAGSPPPLRGALLYRGPDDGHRYYQCQDGWVAVAAIGAAPRAAMAAALGVRDLADAGAELLALTVAAAITMLAGADVPACRVVLDDVRLNDPFLVENDFSHDVAMAEGTARIVAHYSRWPQAVPPRPSAFFDLGEHTDEVFAAIAESTRG